jgi:hypothetical protein
MEILAVSEAFKQETVTAFQKIYSDHKEAVDFKAKFGNSTEKAFANTVLVIAGVAQPCQ